MGTIPLWKTQRVADALGLSVSTVKRLVDAGEIQAARTQGRHRLIPADEALRYAERNNLPATELRRVLGPWLRVAAFDNGTSSSEVGALIEALQRGDESRVNRILQAVFQTRSAVSLGDDLIRPAMETIGHQWETGQVDVYQEHFATRLLENALQALIAEERRRVANELNAMRPRALGAASEDDPYTLAGLLSELVLLTRGWEPVNMGCNLPVPSLARAILDHRPRLVWMSVNYLEDRERFVRDFKLVSTASSQAGAALILGGHALDTELRGQLQSARFCDRLSHFDELLSQLPAARAADGTPLDSDARAG